MGVWDAVYCCSEFIRRRFLEGVADEAGKVIVVYNGIDTEVAFGRKEPVIAFVGRIIPVKGVVELVRAFTLASPHVREWTLAIAGDDPDGLLSGERLSADARALMEQGRIKLLGQVSHAEAMSLYARSEIAVVPSLWEEPFGRSAIEAMSRGCALITTARGGLAEIAVGAAEIADPSNIDAFARSIRCVASDDERRRALQASGLAKARDVFDIRRVTATLDEARARLLAAV